MELGLTILASVLVLIGLIGTVVPGIPGLPLMFLGFVAQSATTDFETPSITLLMVVAGIILAFTLVQLLTAPLATKAFGGTTSGMIGACVGLIIGLLFSFSFFSVLIFPLVGAIVGELWNGQTRTQAVKSGIGATLGFLFNTVIELALGLTLLVVFVTTLF